ncbi:GPW/gp25 family protein [Acinetobacter baumannii]|uniref:GPW/gp25 family protein n=1 Tax=Acinetobacter baumannii TaxID=470 RepID=UPI001CBD585F|nr:GPW/gp25 family protein [Acinetobacter baumannii]
MPTFQTFKDLSVTFKKHPVSDDLVTVKDKAAIVQAITALLLTRKGARPFQPQLGCDIQNVLFEPLDYASAAIIKTEIISVLNAYEPRIAVNDVVCIPDDMNNGYDVELYYTIIGRDDDTPIAVEFFLERTR